MTKLKPTILILTLLTLMSCTSSKLNELDFLIGTWKVEGERQFESWHKADSGDLIGIGYTITHGQRVPTENLKISVIEGTVTYEASVANQNAGATIPFTLSKSDDRWFSFENEEHNFPKKIIYQKSHPDTLAVQVRGTDNEGFSFKLIRRPE